MTPEQFGKYSIGLTLVDNQSIGNNAFRFTMKGKETIVHSKRVLNEAVGRLNYAKKTFRMEEWC